MIDSLTRESIRKEDDKWEWEAQTCMMYGGWGTF